MKKVIEHIVRVYLRKINLEVVIPEKFVWKFMEEFGKKFAIEHLDGSTDIRAVDAYYDHPAGWHVKLTVGEHEESRFNDFLKEFCRKRKLWLHDIPVGK